MVSEIIDIDKEYYLALLLDRTTKKAVFIVSPEGGVEIEEVAKTNPDAIKKFYIDPLIGLKEYHKRNICLALFSNLEKLEMVKSVIEGMYSIFEDYGASLVEINPLTIDKDGKLWAADAKIILDDAKVHLNPQMAEFRDLDQEDEGEITAEKYGLSYVKLDGKIGCVVNGAGLAMATADMIAYFGSSPANFLDVGGSSNPQKIQEAMKILLSDSNVKAILVNIFGGITRCDDIAEGLWLALKELEIKLPLVVCLRGTREREAVDILSTKGIPVMNDMELAIKKVVEIVEGER